MSNGFSANALAGRIQSVDFETSVWKVYTSLCALAHIRGMTKKALALKVFGATEKPSKNFNNSWTMGGNLYSSAISKELRASISEMGIEDAQKAALNALEAHMTAIGATSKNSYELLNKYTDMEDRLAAESNAAKDAEATAQAEQATIAAISENSPAGETQETPAERAIKALDGLDTAELGTVLASLLSRLDAASLNEAAKLVNNARKVAIAAKEEAEAQAA